MARDFAHAPQPGRCLYNGRSERQWPICPPTYACAYDFYGAEKMLFGTDSPFDAQLGDYGSKRTIQAVEQMDIPEQGKRMIFEGNARKLLRLPV